MPYAQQTWSDNNVTYPVSAARMQHIEAGIGVADANATQALAQSIPQPVVNGQFVKGVGGAAVWTAVAPADLAGYPADNTKFLRGDGAWVAPPIPPAAASGVLALRPTAATAGSGSFYYATDQDVLYFSNGSVWTRIGLPAGATTYMFGANAAAPTGWVRYDGATLSSSTGIYADLYAHLGSTTLLPDTRGRVPVDKGTHVDVDTVGKNEGVVAVGNRRPRHRTTNALTGGGQTGTQSANHTHGGPGGYDLMYDTYVLTTGGSMGGSGPIGAQSQTGIESTTHTHNTPAPGGSIGTNVATDSLDSEAYLVGLLIGKL